MTTKKCKHCGTEATLRVEETPCCMECLPKALREAAKPKPKESP